ncbi:MAG: ABC transporter ATP-binding protein, partial [Calditrichaeota bacterium]
LNSAILGFPRRDVEKRFDRIVEFAGLQEFIDAPLRTYSTGMGARLGFSVATDVQPEILIVDEILGVGDATFQQKSFERIQSFQASGSTILLVTHSLERVREMCTRAIWLDQGNLVMEGNAEQVVGQYLEHNKQKEETRLQKQHTIEKEEKKEEKKEDAPKRWGTQRAEITDVCIENSVGNEQRIFQTGDELNLRIRYHAHELIDDAVFGMAVHSHSGVHITGPNTQVAGLELPALQGQGEVLFRVPALPLLEGLYHISVAIVNRADTEIYDYHDRLYDFRVDNTGNPSAEKYGLMTLQGAWYFQENCSSDH